MANLQWYQTADIVTALVALKRTPPDKMGDITARFRGQYRAAVCVGG